MRKELRIVLDEPEMIMGFCGPNDVNLSLLEKEFGIPVYCKGNEIVIDSQDDEKRKLFKLIVDQLSSTVRNGQVINNHLVSALCETLRHRDDDGNSAIRDVHVSIPQGYSKVFPRSLHQARYIQSLEQDEIVFSIGPAGTGKTYLAIAWALKAVLSRTKRKLVLTRPVVEAGESLGFLPGDLVQKLSPYLRPLYDAMEALVPVESIRRLEETGAIEVAPLAYMRGRSLRDCIVILDEAQNTTKEQMKMFLTRIGEGTRAIITGDVTQVDLPNRVESGLLHASRVLGGIDEIRFHYFDSQDVVRNPVVRKIIEAYEQASG